MTSDHELPPPPRRGDSDRDEPSRPPGIGASPLKQFVRLAISDLWCSVGEATFSSPAGSDTEKQRAWRKRADAAARLLVDKFGPEDLYLRPADLASSGSVSAYTEVIAGDASTIDLARAFAQLMGQPSAWYTGGLEGSRTSIEGRLLSLAATNRVRGNPQLIVALVKGVVATTLLSGSQKLNWQDSDGVGLVCRVLRQLGYRPASEPADASPVPFLDGLVRYVVKGLRTREPRCERAADSLLDLIAPWPHRLVEIHRLKVLHELLGRELIRPDDHPTDDGLEGYVRSAQAYADGLAHYSTVREDHSDKLLRTIQRLREYAAYAAIRMDVRRHRDVSEPTTQMRLADIIVATIRELAPALQEQTPPIDETSNTYNLDFCRLFAIVGASWTGTCYSSRQNHSEYLVRADEIFWGGVVAVASLVAEASLSWKARRWIEWADRIRQIPDKLPQLVGGDQSVWHSARAHSLVCNWGALGLALISCRGDERRLRESVETLEALRAICETLREVNQQSSPGDLKMMENSADIANFCATLIGYFQRHTGHNMELDSLLAKIRGLLVSVYPDAKELPPPDAGNLLDWLLDRHASGYSAGLRDNRKIFGQEEAMTTPDFPPASSSESAATLFYARFGLEIMGRLVRGLAGYMPDSALPGGKSDKTGDHIMQSLVRAAFSGFDHFYGLVLDGPPEAGLRLSSVFNGIQPLTALSGETHVDAETREAVGMESTATELGRFSGKASWKKSGPPIHSSPNLWRRLDPPSAPRDRRKADGTASSTAAAETSDGKTAGRTDSAASAKLSMPRFAEWLSTQNLEFILESNASSTH